VADTHRNGRARGPGGVAAGAAGLGAFDSAASAGGATLPATSTVAFAAQGLIATGPTLRLFGETGPEAAIPLNNRGAAFMREAFGGGSREQRIEIPIYLDGQLLSRVIADRLPSAFRTMGMPM
jgi:hypothetical protein